jgi:hypothetical protein
VQQGQVEMAPHTSGASLAQALHSPGLPSPFNHRSGVKIGAGAEGFSNRSDKGLSVDFVEEGGVSL